VGSPPGARRTAARRAITAPAIPLERVHKWPVGYRLLGRATGPAGFRKVRRLPARDTRMMLRYRPRYVLRCSRNTGFHPCRHAGSGARFGLLVGRLLGVEGLTAGYGHHAIRRPRARGGRHRVSLRRPRGPGVSARGRPPHLTIARGWAAWARRCHSTVSPLARADCNRSRYCGHCPVR
jgi:hypothetical protein